MQLTAPTK